MKRKKVMTWSRWRRVRQAVQILAFGLYVYLLFSALQRRAAFPLADLFFRLNPLAALSAMLADRAWMPRLALALITLALTLLLDRVWCGWICPLGTLLEWMRFPPSRKLGAFGKVISPYWRKLKYVILLLILAMALFGSLALLVFDPITLFTRTMTAAVLPALNQAVTAAERALYPIAFLRPLISWIEGVLRGPVLPVVQPVFTGSAFIFLLFLGILALNALADRFWCRYLCPLGGLLGLISKVALLRPVIQPACNRCGHCVRDCRLDAIDTSTGYEIVPSECTVCLDCLAACPEDGIGFRLSRPAPSPGYNPTRRQILTALGVSVVSLALLRTDAWAKKPDAYLIRPPGVDDEEGFLSRCIRCSQCMKVCPTSGLQPTLFESGIEGLWTPRLVPRLGYCDYGCNACGQICPSGAIPPLPLAEKQERVIGMAVVDRNRCLPWAYETPCIVCEEMCPLSEKAIQLEDTGLTDDFGQEIRRPYVLLDRCIGCGICEQHCPMGEAAIEVYRR